MLRDYKNYVKPKAEMSKENVECLGEKTKSFFEFQNVEEKTLATYALAVLVRLLCTDLKHIIALMHITLPEILHLSIDNARIVESCL